MLVPLIVLCSVGRGQDENVFTPGPAMSILPPLEKMATRSALSSAATDMIVGEFGLKHKNFQGDFLIGNLT